MAIRNPKKQPPTGIPKGEAAETLDYKNPIRFPFGPPEESEEHAEVPRRLFAYFLVGEKVCLRSGRHRNLVESVTIHRTTPHTFPLRNHRFSAILKSRKAVILWT